MDGVLSLVVFVFVFCLNSFPCSSEGAEAESFECEGPDRAGSAAVQDDCLVRLEQLHRPLQQRLPSAGQGGRCHAFFFLFCHGGWRPGVFGRD